MKSLKLRVAPFTIIMALLASLLTALVSSASPASAAGIAFAPGDVMAAIGGGFVKHFDATGTLLDTLTGVPSSFNTGMAFDSGGNLYATGFDANAVSKFDTNGNFLGTVGTGYNADPESIAFDAAGNMYVGQADGTGDVIKFDSSGNFVASFDVATEGRGTDWVDLAADQCTLFYTSEGVLVKRFNVCTNTQLADFATVPSAFAYALRIRPNGEVLVAATSALYRFDSAGALLQTYTIPSSSILFAMNLDRDGTSFWTGDAGNGIINRVDIATGALRTTFDSIPNFGGLNGLAIVGEVRAATTATQVSYTGPASVQYSDAATLSGHLQTSAGTALGGYQLDFTLGTQSTAGTPTNASGNVSAPPLIVTQQPGSVSTVGVSFAGDASNNIDPAATSANFTIAKEDCTLAYTGDITTTAASLTQLSAQFGEADSSPGNWTGKSVSFTVTDSNAVPHVFTATTNAAGIASTTAALGADVYLVGVSFAGDDFYLPCATATATIVTVQAANAKITGGGWISQTTGKTQFGFNVIRDVTGLHGQLEVGAKGMKNRFHGTSVSTLTSSGNSGTWTGTGKWNGVAGYLFTASVVDNGTSGKKGDTISIVIKSPTNQIVFTTSGAQPLKGGNIVVH